jgi:hypothetical protein
MLAADLCTDIGLPPGRARDGVWSTNNHNEASFKVFDSVFLELRKNKRFVDLLF